MCPEQQQSRRAGSGLLRVAIQVTCASHVGGISDQRVAKPSASNSAR
jgi:hypothetical protein